MKFLCLGDSALTVQFADEISEEVNDLIRFVFKQASQIKGVVECVPTFVSLSVFFNPFQISKKKLIKKIEKICSSYTAEEKESRKVFLIPTCYEGEFAPDLDFVSKNAGISADEVVHIHSSQNYLIYMLGFLPGFPYLGGLDERIHTPRLGSPRTVIPAGSVGIGGKQTGIYPLASPGGWQLIGRTPIKPYDPQRKNPILYSAGDYIKFVPISIEEYKKIEALVGVGEYECQTEEI